MSLVLQHMLQLMTEPMGICDKLPGSSIMQANGSAKHDGDTLASNHFAGYASYQGFFFNKHNYRRFTGVWCNFEFHQISFVTEVRPKKLIRWFLPYYPQKASSTVR